MTDIPRRDGAILLGTLPAGSVIHAAPDYLKDEGVLYVAAHPDRVPSLITIWGIHPLNLIPEPSDA